MSMYKHILMAVELSEDDQQVEGKVSELLKVNQAELSLIHVIDPIPPIYLGDEFSIRPEFMLPDLDLEKRARKMLKPVADRMGVEYANIFTPIGDVDEQIIEYADEQDVDLIVVGSHGRHGMQLILGSTANAILRHTHCDVLSVRLQEG